jgi:ATP-binding protein involved in chromosome partitioning
METSASSCEACTDGTCAVNSAPKGENLEKQKAEKNLQRRLCHIQNKILVMSGKGGVGKSSTAVNLALALAIQEQAVGLLDIDIHGPSVPKMLGVEGAVTLMDGESLLPVNAFGLKVMSLGLMLENPNDAVIWRGAMKHGVIRQMIGEVAWGYLDYLVVDCPPGTGDEALSVAQTLGVGTRAVIVTTPQDVAILDVRKSIDFCRQLNIPILGIVENMSGFACPGCGQVHHIFKEGGGASLAAETGVPFLGAIPLDPLMVVAGDAGKPCLVSHPDGASAQAFASLARQIL